MSERPVHPRPRRLADWINPTGAKKVHSLIDKVYKRKNLEIAWERVRQNRGSGGVDGESIAAFDERLDERLDQLHAELVTDDYRPARKADAHSEGGKAGRASDAGNPDDLRPGLSAGAAQPIGTDLRAGVR